MSDPQGKILQNGIVSENKVNKVSVGRACENAAVDYLTGLGFELLRRNYTTPYGEADIIMRDGECFVFIEVKARRTVKYGRPAEAVTKKKIYRYLQIAQYFFMNENLDDYAVRFDVAEVYINDDRPRINYIRGAFDFTDISDFY